MKQNKFSYLTATCLALSVCLTAEAKMPCEENTYNMVTIPRGSIQLSGTTVPVYAFSMGRTEVTWAQYQPCIDAGACADNKKEGFGDTKGDAGWGRGDRPVINISWDDANTYIDWLKQKTGKKFRLPTEAEWEYAAQAGNPNSLGDATNQNKASCNGCGSQWDGKKTAPVASFPKNAFGLFDMRGNVWEWVQDCHNEKGKASTANCKKRIVRGGSWYSEPTASGSAPRRQSIMAEARLSGIGFRLAQDF